MKFNVPVVKKCLIDEGEVYTVRSYKSFDRFGVVTVDGVDYLRERLHQINTEFDIVGYLGLSGFESTMDWWNKIKGFGAVGGYMYHLSPL